MTKNELEGVTVEVYAEKIEKLIADEKNPRKIKQSDFEDLKKSLKDFPEMKQLREIVVDEDFKILGGHQRIFALKDLGYKEVIVKKVTGLTPKQKREFIIKDNTSSGTWDTDIIANDWDMQEAKSWGVPDFDIAGSIGPDPANLEDDEGSKKSEPEAAREVECPNCGCQFTA